MLRLYELILGLELLRLKCQFRTRVTLTENRSLSFHDSNEKKQYFLDDINEHNGWLALILFVKIPHFFGETEIAFYMT